MRDVSHHPNDKTLVEIDWTSWLGQAGIDTVVWTIPQGLSSAATDESGNVTKLWFTGGAYDCEYTVDCKVTSDDTESRSKTFSFFVRVARTYL